MHISPLTLPGCWRITPKVAHDARGSFIKLVVASEYQQAGLSLDFAEEYYTNSLHGVLRGMHFQTPPYEHVKLVSCLHGHIRDVILDLRVGSPTFGQCETLDLDARDGCALYLPSGIAHGFVVLSETALVAYKVTSPHVPAHDRGIHWNSLPINWGIDSPQISARDAAFPRLDCFISPFIYYPEQDKLV